MSTLSLASEARAWLEYQALRADPVWRGDGVPRGDGRPVLVLPGLFANDLYLQPLRSWLKRIGYRPLRSTLPVNVGCPERLRSRVERHLASVLNDTDQQLTIIGHSRGGMLGKALVSQLGPRCTCFVALGSPLGAILRAGPEGLAAMAEGRSAGGGTGRGGRGECRRPDHADPESALRVSCLRLPLPQRAARTLAGSHAPVFPVFRRRPGCPAPRQPTRRRRQHRGCGQPQRPGRQPPSVPPSGNGAGGTHLNRGRPQSPSSRTCRPPSQPSGASVSRANASGARLQVVP
ncbi:MAG: hypothetical protein U5R48_16745 [Gammaproteobacteria bacterium]|nr:hypothetical protein [Gammaproteobacteria bacterium]